MTDQQAPAQYLTAAELRREIADATPGVETARYRTRDRKCFRVEELQRVAIEWTTLDAADVLDLDLSGLYAALSVVLGEEGIQAAGNDWGLRRRHLVALYERMDDAEPGTGVRARAD